MMNKRLRHFLVQVVAVCLSIVLCSNVITAHQPIASSTDATNNNHDSVIEKYVDLSGVVPVYVTKNKIRGIDTYETNYNDIRAVWSFNNNIGIITLSVYKGGTLIEETTAPDPLYHPDAYNNITPYAISENEEGWWGYSYYYNTSSAKEDVYWHLEDPNEDITPSDLYFFAAYGSDMQSKANGFMNCVLDMQLSQSQLTAVEIIESINAIKSLVSLAMAAATGGGVGAIAALIQGFDAARNLTTAEVQKTAEVYHYALKADSYYLDIVNLKNN